MFSHTDQTSSHIGAVGGWRGQAGGGIRIDIMSGLHWMVQIKDSEEQTGLTHLCSHNPLLTTQRTGILQRQNT